MKAVTYILVPVILSGILAFPGCVGFKRTVRNVESDMIAREERKYEELGAVEGQHSGFRLFWFIPVTPYADLDKALKEAVSSRGGDAIKDLKVRKKYQIWILGTVIIYQVRGTAIRYTE